MKMPKEPCCSNLEEILRTSCIRRSGATGIIRKTSGYLQARKCSPPNEQHKQQDRDEVGQDQGYNNDTVTIDQLLSTLITLQEYAEDQYHAELSSSW